MKVLLSAAVVLAALLSNAAIVTERNDVFKGVGCEPPAFATFVGSRSAPGIQSCWVPYGTYTKGTSSGAEYLRLTSNLVGVVCSSIGGLAERQHAIGSAYDRYSLYPMSDVLTQRIIDQLSRPLLVDSNPIGDTLEQALRWTASSYGSRYLDAAEGNALPPISQQWTTSLPYNVASSNLWNSVWPLFGTCRYDNHFYTTNSMFYNRVILGANGVNSDRSLYGDDVYDALEELQTALQDMRLSPCVEDILSEDTGLRYDYSSEEIEDDYIGWESGSLRVDWKRIAIICQLERQMELTYNEETGDELPAKALNSSSRHLYTAHFPKDELPASPTMNQAVVLSNMLSDVVWDIQESASECITNDIGWKTPTYRVDKAILGKSVSSYSPDHNDVFIEQGYTTDAIQRFLSSIVTNAYVAENQAEITLTGMFGASSPGSSFGMAYNVYEAIAKVYSGGSSNYVVLSECCNHELHFPAAPPPTNIAIVVDANLTKSVGKIMTFSTPDVRNDVIATFHQDDWDWDRLKSAQRFSLDLLLCWSGDNTPIDDDSFTWETIKAKDGIRKFRMFMGGAALDVEQADNIRFAHLAELNSTCRQEAESQGGDVDDEITKYDEDIFKESMKDGVITAYASIGQGELYNATFILSKGNDWEDLTITKVKDQEREATFPLKIGTSYWYLYLEDNPEISSNKYKRVRADAHQAPTTRNLWRFKNLRDPSL